MRYLRNKVDGTIYEWHPVLANNPKCEEVTEQEAYPERFAPEKVIAKARARKKKVDLQTEDVPEPPPASSPELSADASRDLPE